MEGWVNEEADDLKCVVRIEEFLVRRLYRYKETSDKRLRTVLHAIGNGETDVNRLADTACLGYKQFKRVFMEGVGVNPKDFLRIVRFQKLHRFLQVHTELSLSQLACECGYYDKSHLIKEVRRFSGFTPVELSAACNTIYSDYHSLFRLAFVDIPF
ncbi:MAG: helix-turn-helix domain-containing protein [Bacteroides sp.]|nr:helix-turn-helix domain-containing protein [Bacteroides sp.]